MWMNAVRWTGTLLLLWPAGGGVPAQEAPSPAVKTADIAGRIDRDELESHVRELASEEMAGRGPGAGADMARDYVRDWYADLGLEEAGEDGYLQPIPEREGSANVIGRLPGRDPDRRDEIVLLSAHFDHLGVRNGKIYYGADDDASGMAALLEIARVLVAEEQAPARTILFVAFDLEERGLLGSRRFVAAPPVPLESIAVMINMDMLGRDLGGLLEEWSFVLGSEHSPELAGVVSRAAEGIGLRVGQIGSDVIGIRGDYGPFMMLEVPYLFFSTGEHPDYHQPTDTAERLRYDKLHENTRLVARCAERLANRAERPHWREARPRIEEIGVLAAIIDSLRAKSAELPLDPGAAAMLGYFRGRLEAILRKGEVTVAQRHEILGLVQKLMAEMRRW